MNKLTKSSLPLKAVLFCIICIAILINVFGNWIPSIYWHLTHSNPIEYKDAMIQVPFSWMANELNDAVVLIKHDGQMSLFLVKKRIADLDKSVISQQDIDLYVKGIDKLKPIVKQYGAIDVDHEKGIFIDLDILYGRQLTTRRHAKIIYIPSRQIMIEITSASDTEYLDSLLSIVSFRRRT